VYLREQHIAGLRARLGHPLLSNPVGRLRASAALSPAGLAIDRAAECARSRALLALLEGNERMGREAIGIILDSVPKAQWDLSVQDISRQIGLVMLSTGMVYDWCFPWLDASGPEFVQQAYRLARMLEVGYPPTGQGAVTGHAGEAMLMRDLLGTGLAIYDESPEMYDLTAGRICREFVPARDFFYPAHVHHQGSAYGPYRFRWEVQASWILERAGLGVPFSREQGQVPYRWVYTERPDGKLMPEGDVFAGRSKTAPYLLTAGLYGDACLQGRFLDSPDVNSQDPIEHLLFFDPELQPAPAGELPLGRYFGSPYSGMVLRTAWNGNGEDPAITEFKVKEWHFNNHQHMDAGAFQIWYRGPLAMDTGLYRKYFSAHDGNYCKRTVAHNCLLVEEPGETFVNGRWVNDGGQRWPNAAREARTLDEIQRLGYRTAATIANGMAVDEGWAYLEGDLTASYGAGKVEAHRRAFVWLKQPVEGVECALAVFDNLITASAGAVRRWLLHTAGEPSVEASGTVSGNGEAVLVHQVLLPPEGEFRIEKVGGPGEEFIAGGQNFVPDRAPVAADEAGAWRVEVIPSMERREELLLNLLQVTPSQDVAAAAHALAAATHTGFILGDRAVLFRIEAGRGTNEVSFELPATQPGYRCLVTGLEPGEWLVDSLESAALTVPAESGAASFTVAPGPVRLRRAETA
jgi:heparin/heparan-sulfate lyase